MSGLGVAAFLVWLTVVLVLLRRALWVMARPVEMVDEGFDRDAGWCPGCNLPMEICRHD
jgi:hypothetical protein